MRLTFLQWSSSLQFEMMFCLMYVLSIYFGSLVKDNNRLCRCMYGLLFSCIEHKSTILVLTKSNIMKRVCVEECLCLLFPPKEKKRPTIEFIGVQGVRCFLLSCSSYQEMKDTMRSDAEQEKEASSLKILISFLY